MRLNAVVKNGFYPAPPEAIAAILGHLRMPPDPPPDGQAIHILDPCAGEGKALEQIRQGLLRLHPNAPINAYAVELNASRAERIREGCPAFKEVLGPCSFHATQISSRSFSAVYLNPPFDNEFGGGMREEHSFLHTATGRLVPGGILVSVLPYNQILGRKDLCVSLDLWYENIQIYLFPDGHRSYREAVVFASKRRSWLAAKLVEEKGELCRRGVHYRYSRHTDDQVKDIPRLGQPQYDHWRDGQPLELSQRETIDTWTLPYADGPRQFAKTDLTSEEIETELAKSPLHRKLKAQAVAPMRRPPLPLNRGHTSLLLLTGLLDGYVPSDPPHVVRGYCGKEKQHIRTEEYTTPSGTHVEKRTSAEQPNPICRAVWSDGVIRTFSEKKAESSANTDEFTIEETGEFEEGE